MSDVECLTSPWPDAYSRLTTTPSARPASSATVAKPIRTTIAGQRRSTLAAGEKRMLVVSVRIEDTHEEAMRTARNGHDVRLWTRSADQRDETRKDAGKVHGVLSCARKRKRKRGGPQAYRTASSPASEEGFRMAPMQMTVFIRS